MDTVDASPRVTSAMVSQRSRESIRPLLRRCPEQARSWSRVDAVLVAADEMLREQGLESMLQSPGELAARAGMPNGTFYTYFENSEVVVECLRQVWIERIYDEGDLVFATPCVTWQEIADRLVTVVVNFFSVPSTRILWLSHQLSRTARDRELTANQYLGSLARREIERLGHLYLGDDLDDLLMVEIADQLTRLSYLHALDSPPDPDVLARARRATRAYLATLLHTS